MESDSLPVDHTLFSTNSGRFLRSPRTAGWWMVVMVGMVLGADGASVTRTQRMDGDSNVSTIIGFYAGNLLHDTKLADVVVVLPALV